ncbi:MAG: Crp/Fnr family transcriptional regulator [Bacteroidia bacterium]|nr:Crp/Fnr family transcriptional regulator [Bacteroidia bacterium]
MQKLKEFLQAKTPIGEDSWAELEGLFQRGKLRKGEHFASYQEAARRIAFLESGIVRAYFVNKEGKEYNKQFFTSPGIIGAYTSLLTQRPNQIPQQALVDCEIWVANYKSVAQLYDRFQDLERLGRVIAESYFLEKEQKELEMALLNATERYLLLRKRYPELENQIPQYHIASYLSISTTQLSRIRRRLSEEKIEGF